MRLPSSRVQARKTICEIASFLLCPEELCQLVSRVAALDRAAVASGLCMWWNIYAGI